LRWTVERGASAKLLSFGIDAAARGRDRFLASRYEVHQRSKRRCTFADDVAQGRVAQDGEANGGDEDGDRGADEHEGPLADENAPRTQERRGNEGDHVDNRRCGGRGRGVVGGGVHEAHAHRRQDDGGKPAQRTDKDALRCGRETLQNGDDSGADEAEGDGQKQGAERVRDTRKTMVMRRCAQKGSEHRERNEQGQEPQTDAKGAQKGPRTKKRAKSFFGAAEDENRREHRAQGHGSQRQPNPDGLCSAHAGQIGGHAQRCR